MLGLAKFIGSNTDEITDSSLKKGKSQARKNGRNHAYQGGSLPSEDALKKRYGEFAGSYIEGFLSSYRPELQAHRRKAYLKKCTDHQKRRQHMRTSALQEGAQSSLYSVSDFEQLSNDNTDRQSAINQVSHLSETGIATSDIESIDFSIFSMLREEPYHILSEFLTELETPETNLSPNQSFLVQYNAISAEGTSFILDQDLNPFYSDNPDHEIEEHSLFSL